MKVAVIGAGMSGLVAARELTIEGHEVIVYEKANRIGGTWLYTPETESEDPLGLDPNRKIVHSSSYAALRTNLPRHLMGFPDYPFMIKKNGVVKNFPGHGEVLQFLNEFAEEFKLGDLIRFNVEVVRVEQKDNACWVVESRSSDGGLRSEEIFEAVVVCNGHHSEPRSADVPGIKKWPGKQIHSHNYRIPEPYRDQVVVVIGSGPSAYDICEDISKLAKEVHISSRSPDVVPSKVEMFQNVWLHSEIEDCHENGEVTFGDGASIGADIILHCTGYKYDFPFLKTNGAITVDNNRVGPLYKHVFSPELGPGLSFIGLTYRAPAFLVSYLQAKWVAHVLSGKAILPFKEEMLADVRQHYNLLDKNGVTKNHTHNLSTWALEYLEWLAAQVGLPNPVEMMEIYDVCFLSTLAKGLWSRFREECRILQ